MRRKATIKTTETTLRWKKTSTVKWMRNRSRTNRKSKMMMTTSWIRLTTCSTTNCGIRTWKTWKRRSRRSKKRKNVSRTLVRGSCRTKTWSTKTARWLRATMKKGNKPIQSRKKTSKKRWRRLQMRVNGTATTKTKKLASTTNQFQQILKKHSLKSLSLMQVKTYRSMRIPKKGITMNHSIRSLKSRLRDKKTPRELMRSKNSLLMLRMMWTRPFSKMNRSRQTSRTRRRMIRLIWNDSSKTRLNLPITKTISSLIKSTPSK